MNDDKNGRRSLRKKIVPPKRYAKSPVNTIDVKIGSSTNDSSVQPSTSVPPTTTTNTKQQIINSEISSMVVPMKKRASPRKIKVPSRFIQDGSPTINNLDGTLSSTSTTAAVTDPQQPMDVDKGTSDIAGGIGSGGNKAAPRESSTRRSSSRKITIPARFTTEEAQQISETCHSISNKKSVVQEGSIEGSKDMQGQGKGMGIDDMQGQGIVDNNTVKRLGLGSKAVAASRSSRRSLPPVIHNNNNPINSSTTATTSISSGAVQQQQDEKPKRSQAGRDALKAKRASGLATSEDGTTTSLLAKKKQQGTKEVTAKKRSSRRKVPPPSVDTKSSSSSKSISKSTNSKTVSKASSISGKRTPAQLKYDTNRPIQSKWLNFYTLLQSYKLKYSSIVINSTGSNSGTKVGIDLNSLDKGTNSKSGKYRQAKKEEEIVGKSFLSILVS